MGYYLRYALEVQIFVDGIAFVCLRVASNQCTEFAAARANCPVDKNEKLIPKLQVTET